MFYANKRQQFLVGQGYDFKTIWNFSGINKIPNLIFETEKEKNLLLKQVLANQKSFQIF